MPSLANHPSSTLTKLLLIGDAKTGKTGSLASLVKAGYRLRILDFDNLLDVLSSVVQRDCPDRLGNVEYRSLRDKRKPTPNGWEIEGQPKTFTDAIKMLDRWRYIDDGVEVDLGRPADWGPDCVLVIDSLSRMCDAAYDWRASLAGPKMDGRAVYGDAQEAIENVLAGLTSSNFRTNVIVIAHVQYMDLPDGTKKGFPQGIGQKLSPRIPQYFPSVVLYNNKHDKRTMQTTSTMLIDLTNPKPFAMQPSYPIETGLAEFFRVLQDPPNPEAPREAASAPQITAPNLTLKRA